MDDISGQLISDVADLTEKVPKLQNETISLKKRLTKLSNRIGSLEVLALQDQISSLSDELKTTNNNLLSLSRMFAILEIDALSIHMQKAISQSNLTNPSKLQLQDYMESQATQSRTKAHISSTPLGDLSAFRKECVNCSKEYELNAFETKP